MPTGEWLLAKTGWAPAGDSEHHPSGVEPAFTWMPVRGRSEQQVWGLRANATEEQLDTDNDSML